ncbi:alpha/beta hydrolase [Pseudonocardia sp.]|uniref:alpha/beta hydrolase n=1 Tax=Pseudonocardia sp. TaxID=60912 RepID=UPI00260C0342|nr:alpha/beta hydrolase [Pseudonocardia sp.]
MGTGRAAAIAAGVAGVLAAAGARRPVIRTWPASILQAAPCLPASETPGALSLVHAAIGAAALRDGGGRRPAGLAAAAVNGLAVAALVDLRRDADRTARVFDAALAGLPTPAAAALPLLGGRAARERHLRAADLAYGPDPAQRLDVWGPAGPTAGAPVLVQVHGGGWTGGDKAHSAAPLMAHLVAHGWVCVTVNYRLGPHHRWPAMIVDVKRAIAWVKEHIGGYGGDPSFVAISGGSAGGHLASLAALTANDPAFQPGFAGADTTLAAAVPVYGVHDFSRDEHGLFALLERKVIGTTRVEDPDTWLAASPLHRVTVDAPPFLVVHGDTDTIVSVGQSRRFVRRMREVGAEVRHAELPRAQHGFDAFPTARTGHHVRGVHRFLAGVRARRRVRPAGAPTGQLHPATG